MTPRRRFWLGGAPLATLALLALACGSPPVPAYVRENDAALGQSKRGQHAQAAESYERAAAAAQQPRDAEEARFRAAESYARAGDQAHARALLEALAQHAHDIERQARADFAVADLLERAGQAPAADERRLAALRRHPASGNARAALKRHLDYLREQGGSAAVLAFLDAERAKLESTELGEPVLYFRARELDDTGQDALARDAYLECAERYAYPRGLYWDDALFRAAEKELALNAPERAVAHLEQLLGERESANLVGSYERGRYAEAQLKLGEIYRDALHDVPRARSELRKVWLNHPKSRLADDALFAEALLARSMQDAPGTCQPLSIIVQKLPESRYAACAHELCEALPAGPRPCHDYIKRAAGIP